MSVFKNSILFLLSYLRKTIIFYSQPPLDISFFQASICHTLPGRTTSKTPQPQWVSFPQFCENVGKLKKFNNQWMKVQVKKAFKRLSFLSLKNPKQQTGSAWNFVQPQYKCAAGVLAPVSKSTCPLFCGILIFKEHLNHQARNNKVASKHSVSYHPNTLGLTSRIHPLI